ncbi:MULTISPECIES: replication initiation protein [Spirosoma]|uniref:Replication initiation protein n=1 Tax=Spirosoma liriopis TaxID=2937440 RepID=A0ABT0HVV6_9BACT|nr:MULTISPECIES: replication initiation protein [Spirosoma]MCK8496105.1 replication initiation protein [Spirosoma liriopis]UHG94853.1 replication initiation protein [Spirosoma oryzicola]
MDLDNKLIVQDNAITSARYEMNALEKNIIYMMMSQLRKDDTADTIYYVSVRELMEKTATRNSYEDFKRATEQLIGRVLQIHRPNGNLLQVSMISSAEYIAGQGVIEIGLDPKIRPFFFDLKQNFTAFQLHMALSLDSKYAKRVYEMLAQYKNLGQLTIEVVELKRRLYLYDEKTGVEQYRNWADFERRILSVAQKEINEKTDLRVTYTTVKQGRRVSELHFAIQAGPQQIIIDYKDEDTTLFGRLVNEFRLRKEQAQAILDKMSSAEITKRLYEIQLMRSDNKIQNIGGYTAKAFGV